MWCAQPLHPTASRRSSAHGAPSSCYRRTPVGKTMCPPRQTRVSDSVFGAPAGHAQADLRKRTKIGSNQWHGLLATPSAAAYFAGGISVDRAPLGRGRPREVVREAVALVAKFFLQNLHTLQRHGAAPRGEGHFARSRVPRWSRAAMRLLVWELGDGLASASFSKRGGSSSLYAGTRESLTLVAFVTCGVPWLRRRSRRARGTSSSASCGSWS